MSAIKDCAFIYDQNYLWANLCEAKQGTPCLLCHVPVVDTVTLSKAAVQVYENRLCPRHYVIVFAHKRPERALILSVYIDQQYRAMVATDSFVVQCIDKGKGPKGSDLMTSLKLC